MKISDIVDDDSRFKFQELVDDLLEDSGTMHGPVQSMTDPNGRDCWATWHWQGTVTVPETWTHEQVAEALNNVKPKQLPWK